ncbi:LysR substrate-binding domain-containing protein [Fontisubflavum oceani]|uniref:LysR substrate-binding domain-containing protein n=1 Tax=Fontisubflavum oceani TaxID=2978973 RepID=UPI0025B423AF|nr:LysR substrate-binding domain-containing protein [Fontisubflavum oceani]WJY22949.1 LysR substrate-binding domain-containing protein [Fontisubflavum oceani]
MAQRIAGRIANRLKLRQLRLLIAVGRHGSIQNAAREMNVSQPAATKMIQDLELDFAVQLFTRTNRGVIATPAGEVLIRHCKLIFAQIANAAEELDDLSEGNSGRIVVGTLLAASSHLLPKAIETMLATRPGVALRVVEGTNEMLMPALRNGEIDMVVGRLPSQRHRQELEQIVLFEEHILAVVGPDHPLARRADLRFSDLEAFGWILPPAQTTLRRQIDQFFVGQDLYVPPMMVESISYLTNRTLIQNNELIGFMPAHVAEQDIALGLLAALSWKVPFGTGPVGVTVREKDNLSPAADGFLTALRQVANAI